MTTVVLSRRNLLAAGGSVLATGVSGLVPSTSMPWTTLPTTITTARNI